MPEHAGARHKGGMRIRLLIFTDLDGTLLDHHDYSWLPARGAIGRALAAGHQIIPTTSKTLAETRVIQDATGIQGPVIVENGSALYLPPNLLGLCPEAQQEDGWGRLAYSPAYAHVRRVLNQLRLRHGYRFSGFGDMSVDEVMAATGLNQAQAAASRQRCGSEPIRWEDAAERMPEFRQHIEDLGLRIVAGGRFLHILGRDADKSRAMSDLIRLFASADSGLIRTMALGDGPNDLDMLRAADYPVLVANPAAPPLDAVSIGSLRRTRATGPRGWAEAVGHVLDSLDSEDSP